MKNWVLVLGMDVANDPTGTIDRTKNFWYYLEDLYLWNIFMPDNDSILRSVHQIKVGYPLLQLFGTCFLNRCTHM